MASGWNLWVGLERSVVSGRCCKEVCSFFGSSIPTFVFINPRHACTKRGLL